MSPKHSTIPRTCDQCGASYSARSDLVRAGTARYCSLACRDDARRKSKIPFICAQCGHEFAVFPYRLERNVVQFCSQECHVASQKAHALVDGGLFWANTEQVGECWIWAGPKNPQGYGQVQYLGYTRRAHRVAYELVNGPIPAGLMVCHTCDTPACVNPRHFFLGTAQDNVDDSIRKGRFAFGTGKLIGANSPAAKLTNTDVLEIRALAASGCSVKDIMLRFGMSKSQIHSIIKRKTWKHI